MRTSTKLLRFIERELLDEGYEEDPLLEGLVDSLAAEQIVAYIEGEWGVVLADEEMIAENFETVDVLAALVESKMSKDGRKRRGWLRRNPA